MNVNSIRSDADPIDGLRLHIHDHPGYHRFGVAETWLDSNKADEDIRIDGYSVVRQDRNANGGGVALYISEQYSVKVLSHSNTEVPWTPEVLEYLICSVHTGTSEPVLVCLVYRPPHVPFTRLSELLDELRDLSSDFSHKIILGDFNADLCRGGADAQQLRRLADDLSLQIVPHGPTHISPTFRTWLDVILVDDNDTIRSVGNMPAPFRSRHQIINVELQLPAPQPICESYAYRDFKGIDGDRLVEILGRCDWEGVDGTDLDIESAVKQLHSNLMGAVEILAPLKQVRYAKKRFPWIGAELRGMQRRSKTLYRRYKRTGETQFLEEFLELRGRFQDETAQAKTEYVHNRLFKSQNSNTIWRELRGLGLLPRPRGALHGLTPDQLNTHFASVSISTSNEDTRIDALLASAEDEGFSFKEITLNDVWNSIAGFSSQAVGEDGIPQSVVKKAFPVIGSHLVRLFNASLAGGSFPEVWKKAHVVPFAKRRTPSSPDDFRPIALLCFLSKVLERIVCN